MITERIMPIAMFLFFIMIGINGFIAVSGGLYTGQFDNDGHPVTLNTIIGGNIMPLSSDLNGQAGSIIYNPSGQDQATTTTSAGFSLWDLTPVWNGVVGAVSKLMGVENVYLMNNAINGIEIYMDAYILWFPGFTAIFLAIKYLCLGIKMLAIGYAGTIAVRAIVGRGIF